MKKLNLLQKTMWRHLQKVEQVQLQVMIVQVRNPEHQSVKKKSDWEQLLNRYYIKGEYIY